MTWRQWLHARSRDETALQRLVAGILLAGFLAGVLVDAARNAFEGDRRPADAAAPENLASSADAAAAWRDAQRAAERGAWREVATGVGETWRRSWAADAPTLLAVAGGVCWLVFLLQAGQTFGDPPRVVALLAGVALGVASIAPTLFFSLWQEFAWGLAESDQGLPGVRFYVLGVGLREEAAKLLCGAALLPWLAFRRDELAALIAFAGVGLGFAAAENVRYIAATGGAATLGRLLTPLPFHVALTGLAGVHLYRACRRPQEQAAPCAAVLLAVVVAHGLNDAALG
jgi:RsiW-degrading membrane proteinase PrsW (M82 family)